MRSSKSAAALVFLATSGVALGQVVVPPGAPAAETPKIDPPPLPPPPPPPPTVIPDDLEYDPITPRDASGNAVELDVPHEYMALGHNVWLDARMLARSASVLQARRLEIEQLIVDNLDRVERLASPELQNLTVERDDPVSGEKLRLVQESLSPFVGLRPVHVELMNAGAIPRRVGDLHQKISNEYQSEIQSVAMAEATAAGADPIAAIVPFMMRATTSEIMYFYDLLAVTAADSAAKDLDAWASGIELSATETAAVRDGLAGYRGAGEDDKRPAAQALLARLGPDARKRAMQRAMLSREAPEVTELPDEEVSFRPMTTEERRAAVFGVIGGQAFDWGAYVTNADSSGG